MHARRANHAFATGAIAVLALLFADRGAASTDVPGDDSATAATSVAVAADEATADRPVVRDAEIEPWRLELIRLGFDVATRIPVHPHVRDRSRVQGDVLEAMLRMDQPLAVRELCKRIENWRRAETLSRIALHLAEQGADPSVVREYIEISDANHPADLERWRHDRIEVPLARALVRIGAIEEAARLERAFEVDSQGVVIDETTATMSPEEFALLVPQLDGIVEQGSLDQVMNVIEILIGLHARFYEDPDRRAVLEDRVDAAAVRGKVPHDLRVKYGLRLADEANRRGDLVRGRELSERARGVLDGIHVRTPFPAEFLIPIVGEVALRRAEAGDSEQAREEIEEALRALEAGRKYISDVFRARALRPVAVAAVATGDRELADRVFLEVVEVGATNPNARPRAEDLARTLAAMALAGHEPSEELRKRIDEIAEGLGDPW